MTLETVALLVMPLGALVLGVGLAVYARWSAQRDRAREQGKLAGPQARR
jgi:cytochrome c-type biogenesis protein CcmH/NrfF